jgi:hypothetical protein
MKQGQTVKFKHPLTENEAGECFTVMELRGPRVLVQAQNSGFSAGFVPTAVYLASDLIEIE